MLHVGLRQKHFSKHKTIYHANRFAENSENQGFYEIFSNPKVRAITADDIVFTRKISPTTTSCIHNAARLNTRLTHRDLGMSAMAV